MSRIFLFIAAILGGLAVIAGAFGTHALRGQLSERALEVFGTGVRYQMYHALALLLVGVLLLQIESPRPLMVATGVAFVLGTLIFSGSLYGLSLTGIGWLGAITPIGGAVLIVGWGGLAIAAWRLSVKPQE
ncbi:MAG: DUF423 domain-containing protein [Microcoleaceae cyanobacterium]